MRWCLFAFGLVVVGCGGGEAASAPPSVPATSASTTPAHVAPEASTAPVASAPASAPPSAGKDAPAPAKCATVEWGKPGTIIGMASSGAGQNGRMESEKYIAVDLASPICGADGQPVARIQLIPQGNDTYGSLSKLVGKKVMVDGEPDTAGTAHHHEPIIFSVKKISAQ